MSNWWSSASASGKTRGRHEETSKSFGRQRKAVTIRGHQSRLFEEVSAPSESQWGGLGAGRGHVTGGRVPTEADFALLPLEVLGV